MRSLFSLVCCAALFLAACGGGGDGGAAGGSPPPGDPAELTARITPAGGSLDPDEPVMVQFSHPTGSMQLGGTFMTLVPATSWSARKETLTLAPPAGGWPRGQGGTLTVHATAAGGASMAAPVTASFLVPLRITSGHQALAAIGQTSLTVSDSQATGGRSSQTLHSPQGNVAVAPGGRMFIADQANHRILGYAAIPAYSDAAADIVLGQPDFNGAINNSSRGTFDRPMQVAVGAGRIAVADLNNHRVLVWSTIPTVSRALPDMVVGQANYDAPTPACSATRLNFPESVFITPDGKMLVADTDNQRVLVWLSVPTVPDTPADLVLGQSDFTHCRRNDDNQDGIADAAPSARTLWRPSGLWSDGERLVVLDSSNHRALVWTTFPTASFQPAQLVLGQGSFTRATRDDDDQDGIEDATPSARTLDNPVNGVHSNGVQLAIADSGNHRVLVWNSFPTTSFQPADAVLGQPNFTGSAAGTAADRMNRPTGVTFHGDKLLVTEHFNNRVLVLQSR